MKLALPAVRMTIFLTILTGVVYPLAVTLVGQVLFHAKANGGLIERGGVVVGSKLIAQKFEGEKYFWSRPSGVDFNAAGSGGSNLGQASADLKKAYDERLAKLKSAHPDERGEPPQDLLFASGSGLDPHISPEAADYQLNRVARARSMDANAVRTLVAKATEARQLGLLGEPRVNVFKLNLELDEVQLVKAAPTPAPTPAPSGGPNVQ